MEISKVLQIIIQKSDNYNCDAIGDPMFRQLAHRYDSLKIYNNYQISLTQFIWAWHIMEYIINKDLEIYTGRSRSCLLKKAQQQDWEIFVFMRTYSFFIGEEISIEQLRKRFKRFIFHRIPSHKDYKPYDKSVIKQNYRARYKNLPRTLTATKWEYALNYFNGCCAVCERQLNDLFNEHTAAMDHWIPLSYEGGDNPGTVATNIVPLCHGIDGCNNSKGATMPDIWLRRKFSERKAQQIETRITEYFEHIKEQSS